MIHLKNKFKIKTINNSNICRYSLSISSTLNTHIFSEKIFLAYYLKEFAQKARF